MASDNVTVPDGAFDWSGGVDSSKVRTLSSELNPNGLKRNQLAWLINGTVRDGGITQRPGWQPLSYILQEGRWQGGFVYEPDSDYPYLVCQISGILYRVLLVPPYTITDLTGGDVSLQNPADVEMAFFIQAENYLIVQAGDYLTGERNITTNAYGEPLLNASTTLPLFWNGTTLRRSRGLTTLAPTNPDAHNEIPAGTTMDYYGQRVWYAQARQCAAGDMVGGASGTAANYYRDAVLKVTENPLCLGGDGFTVPTNTGNIRAIKHSSNINASLGQGQLYIFTRKSVYSLTVPLTRTDWINADANNQPQITVVQINNGAVGDRCIVPVNGDLFYMSFDPAVRSLITAVRFFGQWGNTPISQNERRVISRNDRSLMRFASAVEFDNRALFCVLPETAADGKNTVHKAMLPLDFDIVTNFEEKTAPVWEGVWEGMQILQLFTANIGGVDHCYASMISDVDASINLWEISRGDTTENGDNRVTWAVEFPAYTWSAQNLEYRLKKLMRGELWLDKLIGTVEMDVWYRQDAEQCWWRWHHDSICASRTCGEADPPLECYPDQEFCAGFRSPVIFPAPKGVCDSMGVRSTLIGYQFQVKIVFKGFLRIRGFLPYVVETTQPDYQGMGCQPGLQNGMAKLPNPFA